jgi:hypothetical protein
MGISMALDRQQIIDRLDAQDASRDLSGLDLTGADLSRMDLRGVNFSRADLTSADLRWAVLDGADLDSTVLRRADMRWAVLRGANLRYADLVRANLAWTDLASANLTGADLDGASLDSANLDEAVIDGRSNGRRRTAGVRAPVPGRAADRSATIPRGVPGLGGLALPPVTRTTVAAALGAAVAVVFAWGWLFRRAYFVDGFGLGSAGLVRLGDTANLTAGVVRVVGLELGLLALAPLILVALALVLALVAALPLLLTYITERVLGDIARPEVRPFVIGGLFVAMTILFVLILSPALGFAREASANAMPTSAGLASVIDLFRIGGWLTQLALLAVLGLAGVVLWVLWRAFSYWLAGYDLPPAWRLRYPALGSALINLRESRLAAWNDPLSAVERRRGALAAGALVLLLGTALTGVGRVHAYRDMCDGGDLPRMQLFVNGEPANAGALPMCERMLAETDDQYFVFFPQQTVEQDPGDVASRAASVQAVDKDDTVTVVEALAGADDCPTCASTPDQKTTYHARFVVDPSEVEVSGTVVEHSADLVTLDVPAGQVGTVRLGQATVYTQDGQAVSVAAVVPGASVVALGRLSADGLMLDARQVDLLPQTAPVATAQLTADLSDPQAMVISGSGYRPGSQVAIGLGPVGKNAPQEQLVLEPVTVGADGTFSVPVRWREGLSTGPGWQIIARDPDTRQYATSPWLQQAPPSTPTPLPTSPPRVVEEATATPEGGEATATTSPEGTNTPLPTRLIPGGGTTGGGASDCQGDTYEPDWPRGLEKEIYLSFGETAASQKHTFCGRGDRYNADIDLAYFRVKKDRWYRVKTSNLAPGVDTVIAVGDLSSSTDCRPVGCWNDDRAALTFESEIVFKTVEDGRAMITVDNRGSARGAEAGYDLSVSEFQPEPTTTPTPEASRTASATPTITATPLPLRDRYELGDRCRKAEMFGPLEANVAYEGTIDDRTDEDWYYFNGGDAYLLELDPPPGQDYDLEVHQYNSESSCPPIRTPLEYAGIAGEGVAEYIGPYGWAEGAQFAVKVFSPYPSVYNTPHAYYRLILHTVGTPRPTSTVTPSPTPSPTRTPVPTFTPSPTATTESPTPETDVLPRIPTARATTP